jgi:hypothetical protein
LLTLLFQSCEQGSDGVPRQEKGWGEDNIVLHCQQGAGKLPVQVSCLQLTSDYAAAGIVLRDVNAEDNTWISRVVRGKYRSLRHYLLGVKEDRVLLKAEYDSNLNQRYNDFIKRNLVETVWKFMDCDDGSATSAVPCQLPRPSLQQSAQKVKIMFLIDDDYLVCRNIQQTLSKGDRHQRFNSVQ